jgi:hypothetical protein
MLIEAIKYYRWRRNLSCWSPLLGKLDSRKNSQPVSLKSFLIHVYKQILRNFGFVHTVLVSILFKFNFLVIFDKISFDQRVVHQCIGKDTHKCISH